jgi:DNA-directed RNA polymerase
VPEDIPEAASNEMSFSDPLDDPESSLESIFSNDPNGLEDAELDPIEEDSTTAKAKSEDDDVPSEKKVKKARPPRNIWVWLPLTFPPVPKKVCFAVPYLTLEFFLLHERQSLDCPS